MIVQKYMEIEILEDWMGNPPGSIMNLLVDKAEELISRGAAKYIDLEPEPEPEPEPKVVVETKQIEKPPMNKMIAKAPAKKAGRPKKK